MGPLMIEKIIANLSANFESRVKLFRVLTLIVALTVTAISSSKMIRAVFAHGDFGVYLHAARLMVAGENIYTTPTHPVENGGLFYIYPPLLAMLLVPLTYIPDNVSIVLWCLLNVFLVAWAIPAAYEIVSGSSFSALPVRTRWAIGFFSLLLTARFILQHLDRGEANILEMALLLLGIKLARSDRRSVLGGAVIGVSMALKVITAPFTLWYALQKNVKALAGAANGSRCRPLVAGPVSGLESQRFLAFILVCQFCRRMWESGNRNWGWVTTFRSARSSIDSSRRLWLSRAGAAPTR